MNILINAYACAPNWGSEQGMAWHWITELAKMHNLYVITEGEWKKEIEEALCSGTLSIDELTEKSKRLPEIKDALEEKEMRWLELSEIDG